MKCTIRARPAEYAGRALIDTSEFEVPIHVPVNIDYVSAIMGRSFDQKGRAINEDYESETILGFASRALRR